MTCKKLFYEDVYLKEFDAEVLLCEQSGENYIVELDCTAFYPEGGGQPHDTGVLGDARVLEVHEKNGRILHLTDKPLAGHVHGKIDWKRRFSFMQHHTGEHIVSGLIHTKYGLDNVGFHMGGEYTTMDINGELNADELQEIEFLANAGVYENAAVNICYPDAEVLAALKYRSKKALTGDVRIVKVGSYDTCACCGLHCGLTGEIGLVKFAYTQKYKGGVRIYMLCGEKAVTDYIAKNKDIYGISQALSVKPQNVAEGVSQLLAENNRLKQQISAYKDEIFKQRAERAEGDFYWLFAESEENLSADDLRKLCMALGEKVTVAAVFGKTDESNYKYAVGSSSVDVREIGKELNSRLNGRGGGQKALVQGNVSATRAKIEDELLRHQLNI